MRVFPSNEFVGAIIFRNWALEHLEEFTNESKLASNLNLITTANLKKVQYLYIIMYPLFLSIHIFTSFPQKNTLKVLFIFHNVHPGTQHQRDASARYVVQDAAEWADHDYHDFFHPNVAVPWRFFSASQ